MSEQNTHTDVVLLAYGEPYRNSFFEQWRYSNRILNKLTRRVAPIPRLLVPVIGAYRGVRRTRSWNQSRYLSPLESITEKQREKLEKELLERDASCGWAVHVAYEFRDPDLLGALRALVEHGGERILIIPMYVARADFTSGLSREACKEYRRSLGNSSIDIRYIEPEEQGEGMAAVMGSFIRRELEGRCFDLSQTEKRGLLLGAHGTIVSPHAAIQENGFEATYRLGKEVMDGVSDCFEEVSIGWFNHERGGEWTSPSMEEAARAMLENGIEEFVYFPFGFLADNEETELNAKTILESVGIRGYTHLPCVNEDDEFIDLLADCVCSTAGRTWGQNVC